jgi:SWI/SNF-related matrix-associated actin-dependent regulator of chromatin subfamily A member 5
MRRVKTPFSYAESESSENRSSFNTPPSQRTEYADLEDEELNEDEDEEEIQYTTSRRSLRAHKSNNSLKFLENGEANTKRPRSKKRSAIEDLIGANLTPMVSERVAIRQEIAIKTAANRNRFLIEKKDFWLPLLPPNNYVRKLVEKHEQLSEAERARLPGAVRYSELETQPRGVKAVMKPYQLSGLSFLVYLQKNGLSGILGS